MPENCAAIVIAAKHHELTKVKDTRGTTNTIGALRCKFQFRTDDWLHSAKTAMFCNGDAVLHPEVIENAIAVPLDTDDECPVPYEVLTDTLPYSIGVWGITDKGLRVVSNWLVFNAQVGCFVPGQAPSDPEPTMYEKILLTAQDALNTANEVVERANRGEFNGKDGTILSIEISEDGYWVVDGEKTHQSAVGKDGLDGTDGADGYTPIKGVDYFDGKDGKDGIDGKSVTIVSDNDLNDACIFALKLCKDGSIGHRATLTGFNFGSKDKIITINGKEFTAADGKWIYNAAVATSNASSYSMIIYDKNYAGTLTVNNYGAAIVLNADGKLVKIYDGANVGYYTEAGKATSAHFTSSTYATVAFSELASGELLIIFPNDGGSNAARGFALGLRFDGSIGKEATLTGFAFGNKGKILTINGNTFEAGPGKWLYNKAVESNNATAYSMLIFSKDYTGTLDISGNGVAIVLGAGGKLIRVYDGVNLKYYTEDGSVKSAHFTEGTFDTVALSELGTGEDLIVFPNSPDYHVITFSDGKDIKIKNGSVKEGSSSSDSPLPSYGSANEGQLLMIVNGTPTWTTISTSTVSYDSGTRTLSITAS